jgi:hypothetical protein
VFGFACLTLAAASSVFESRFMTPYPPLFF